MTEFGAYQMYMAIKLHFQSEQYDVFRFNGKVKANKQKFEQSGKYYIFRKLASKYKTEKEMCEFLVANFTSGKKNGYIFESEEAKNNYLRWRKRKESLSYVFQQELDFLFNSGEDIYSWENGHPFLLRSYLGNKICIETMVLLNRINNYINNFDSLGKDDIIWPSISLTIKKYDPFLKVDMEKFEKIYSDSIKAID